MFTSLCTSASNESADSYANAALLVCTNDNKRIVTDNTETRIVFVAVFVHHRGDRRHSVSTRSHFSPQEKVRNETWCCWLDIGCDCSNLFLLLLLLFVDPKRASVQIFFERTPFFFFFFFFFFFSVVRVYLRVCFCVWHAVALSAVFDFLRVEIWSFEYCFEAIFE